MRRTRTLAALLALAIAGPAAAGSAVLTWEAPTENTDGSTLTDLAGFRVRWGCVTAGDYPNERTILHPGLRSFLISDLPNTGTCYFTVHAINSGRVDTGNGLSVSADESDPSNPAQKVMNSAAPREPYTRLVDWQPAVGVAPLERLDGTRMFVGFVGDPLEVRANATSSPTRHELRTTFFQSGEQVVYPFTTASTTWTPPFAGLWVLEVRSCNANGCGLWRSSREDNSVFWFKLKPPTGGGIE